MPLGNGENGSRLPQPTRAPSRTSPLKFFVSSATLKSNNSPSSQKAWQTDFLNDLRYNRPARPSGSRPLPNRDAAPSPVPPEDYPLRTSSAMSGSIRQERATTSDMPDRCLSAMSQRRVQSSLADGNDALNDSSKVSAQQLYSRTPLRNVSAVGRNSTIIPSATYRESGQRWIEKQEARSLREALEDIDNQDEERLYAAAQIEASELVWKHRNPDADAPYRNPDAPYKYVSHLTKGIDTRNQNIGHPINLGSISNINQIDKNPEYLGYRESKKSHDHGGSPEGYRQNGREAAQNSGVKGHVLWDSPQKRAYMNMSIPQPSFKVSGRRQSSSSRSRKVSAGLFRNPKDQIYEDPNQTGIESEAVKNPASASLNVKPCETISPLQAVGQTPSFRSDTPPAENSGKLSRFEIHKNPPSQSRNPSYLRNPLPPTPPDSTDASDSEARSNFLGKKNGIEIRSGDIRAATSMLKKDRSPKLPSPTVVSDRRERPIVSFERNWKPKEASPGRERVALNGSLDSIGQDNMSTTAPLNSHLPVSTVAVPKIPTVNLPEPPVIHVDDDSMNSSKKTPIPAISVSSDFPSAPIKETPHTVRPLPKPSSKTNAKPATRPFPHHLSTGPPHSSTPHWSPSPGLNRATAQCYACALPIAGRIVSAASQRFHPHCFTCHHCSTLLEHVAFYPEPDNYRAERLARIDARANGANLPEDELEGKTAADDGDDGLHFFCHLDFHEKFSPRCRSCKTPIEGEVVIACGGEWHVGHFFCAECGDPFDSKTPFVEKDGFAWCVGCHTRRFSGKCKGCRKPIVDLVVRAMGGEWHEGCFRCKVSDV